MSQLPAERRDAATPALADQWEAEALTAIEQVDDPATAEGLLARIKLAEQAIRLARLGAERERRWGRVRLLGERRYGELLGPPAPGKRTDLEPLSAAERSTGADHEARRQARELAAVPDAVFTQYVEAQDRPTRAGLLRAAKGHRAERSKAHRPSDGEDHALARLWDARAAVRDFNRLAADIAFSDTGADVIASVKREIEMDLETSLGFVQHAADDALNRILEGSS